MRQSSVVYFSKGMYILDSFILTLIKTLNEEVSPHLTAILFLVCFISNNRYSLNKWQRLDARGNKKGIDAQFFN